MQEINAEEEKTTKDEDVMDEKGQLYDGNICPIKLKITGGFFEETQNIIQVGMRALLIMLLFIASTFITENDTSIITREGVITVFSSILCLYCTLNIARIVLSFCNFDIARIIGMWIGYVIATTNVKYLVYYKDLLSFSCDSLFRLFGLLTIEIIGLKFLRKVIHAIEQV